MIQNFGGGEVIVIIIVALVVLGPDRLPEMARGAGRMLHKFRTMTSGLQGQVRDVMDDPAMKPLKELGEFAARPRQKLSEYALEAEADERAKSEKDSLDAADTGGTDATAETTGASSTGASSNGTTSLDPQAAGTAPQPTPVRAVADPSAPPKDLVPGSDASPPPATPAPADPAPVAAADAAGTDAVDPTERESA